MFGSSQIRAFTPPNQHMRPCSLGLFNSIHGKEFGRAGLQENANSFCGWWPTIDAGQLTGLLREVSITHRNALYVIRSMKQ